MPPDAPGEYYMARMRGREVGAISGIQEGAPPIATWNTYVWVDSADEAAARVRDAGGVVTAEPFDVMDAGRMAVFADPEGAAFCVWQPNAHRGWQIVNEHGTVNFNNLNTRDREAAAAFYGAVFGWELLDLGGGGAMWRMGAYGDHLEERDPGLKQRIREMGAVDRFADVVAALVPLGDDQAGTPAHWSVTFAVDDADAAARRATELGGKVLAAPFDAPWVRMAILADPAGATFIASQFVPENRDVGSEASAASAA